MKSVIFISAIVISCVAIIVTAVFAPRIYKDFHKKKNFANTYAIQNIATGKNLRVHNANPADGAKLILYSHHNWECITWQLIQLEGDTYLLKNLYTQKTFQPASTPEQGVTLWQQTLGGNALQYWELIKQSEESYLIRLKSTELYLTTTSDEDNSDIILMPKQDRGKQKWRLIRQNPII